MGGMGLDALYLRSGVADGCHSLMERIHQLPGEGNEACETQELYFLATGENHFSSVSRNAQIYVSYKRPLSL